MHIMTTYTEPRNGRGALSTMLALIEHMANDILFYTIVRMEPTYTRDELTLVVTYDNEDREAIIIRGDA